LKKSKRKFKPYLNKENIKVLLYTLQNNIFKAKTLLNYGKNALKIILKINIYLLLMIFQLVK
jgi:hypothetical protein